MGGIVLTKIGNYNSEVKIGGSYIQMGMLVLILMLFRPISRDKKEWLPEQGKWNYNLRNREAGNAYSNSTHANYETYWKDAKRLKAEIRAQI